MIRTNLSTRPFYNEGAVNAGLIVLALVLAVASVFNVNRILYYSRSDTTLAQSAARDEERARDLRTTAARLRSSLDAKELDLVSDEARRANELIDERTFSWTDLFNRLEMTLPDEVRITAVRPRVDRHGTSVTLVVVGRGVDEVNRFIESLEATHAFTSPLSREEHVTEHDELEATIEAGYAVPAAPAATNASAAAAEVPR